MTAADAYRALRTLPFSERRDVWRDASAETRTWSQQGVIRGGALILRRRFEVLWSMQFIARSMRGGGK